jgi:RNA polymerase sigma-70 factor (ECF subfamily)
MRDRGDVSTAIASEPADAELLAAVAAGDRPALRALYERHAPWLLARLQRRCADPDRVDDALQDTFVAVWRGAGRWNGSGEVGAWLWGIAIRRLIDSLRRHPAREPLPAEPVAEPSAEELVLAGVEHGDLAGALNRLSPELRAVVQATILDDLTTKEAGRLLGIPAGTVKTRMMRARAQLREELA